MVYTDNSLIIMDDDYEENESWILSGGGYDAAGIWVWGNNLTIENNLIIFGDDELESFVWEHRDKNNTQFVKRDLDWFKSTIPFEKIH